MIKIIIEIGGFGCVLIGLVSNELVGHRRAWPAWLAVAGFVAILGGFFLK